MNGIKYVFIDIDNTLLDFDECVREGLIDGFRKYGLGEFRDEYYSVFHEENNKLWKRLEKGEIDLAELKRIRFSIIFRRIGIDFDGPTFEANFRTFIHEFVTPVKGAQGLLESLYGKYTLCAASNGPYEQQIHRLEKAGMSRYFSYVFISENLGAQKPSHEFFEKAFERIGSVRPDECVMIGDSYTSDVQGGKNMGMKTIYFNKHHSPDHPTIIPDYSFCELSDITKLFQ